jgi:hypothetical protein
MSALSYQLSDIAPRRTMLNFTTLSFSAVAVSLQLSALQFWIS